MYVYMWKQSLCEFSNNCKVYLHLKTHDFKIEHNMYCCDAAEANEVFLKIKPYSRNNCIQLWAGISLALQMMNLAL